MVPALQDSLEQQAPLDSLDQLDRLEAQDDLEWRVPPVLPEPQGFLVHGASEDQQVRVLILFLDFL